MTVDLRFVVDLIETLRKLCMAGWRTLGGNQLDACGFNWFKHSAGTLFQRFRGAASSQALLIYVCFDTIAFIGKKKSFLPGLSS